MNPSWTRSNYWSRRGAEVRSLVARLIETIAPTRLGRSFRWLLSATIVNNVGDGVALAAGPLLVASQTRDPFLVSMAVLSEYLPALLFGVIGGAAADRFDRRRMVVVVNIGRAFVLAVLVVTIVSGTVNIALVLVALFILGTAETFADSASSTPAAGPRARARTSGIANARMQGAFLLTNQLAAAADRRVPVRARDGPAVRDERRRASPSARCSSRASSTDVRERSRERSSLRGRDGRGGPLARRPSADADAGADDLHVQRDVRGGVVGARPVRRASGSG